MLVALALCGEAPPQWSGEEASATEEETIAAQVKSAPELEAASKSYGEYVVEETDELVEDTEQFTDAVISGDVEGAKELYTPTRVHWERIEPVAASLGDLDPQIDAREGDVPEEEWSGFHRIEQALW